MNTKWTVVDSITAIQHKSRPSIMLEPGEIRRRPFPGNIGNGYGSNFKRRGLTDYHAAIRTIDGQSYLYIWRDPLPEGALDKGAEDV